MDGDPFQFLSGISPWWWVAVASVLGAIEVVTFSFFLIWPALSALGVALLLWIFPEMSGSTQLMWFALTAIGFTVAGRQVVFAYRPTSDRPNLNQRGAALIGRTATVIDGFAGGGAGNVTVDGIRWRGRLVENAPRPSPGDILDVVDADGMTLVLEVASDR